MSTKKAWVIVTETRTRAWKVEVPADATDDAIVDYFWNTDCESAEPNVDHNHNADVIVADVFPCTKRRHDRFVELDEGSKW